jgi:cation:H+ antiporter
MLDLWALALSLLLLAVAGDQFVLGIARLASTIGARASVVGAVIGGLGASLPDLAVAAIATGGGDPQLAAGSLVGSTTANVCLALAVAALIEPIRVDSRTVRREAPASVAAVLLFAAFLLVRISAVEAIVAIALLPFALTILAVGARTDSPDELSREVADFYRAKARPRRELTRAILSLVAMVAGAELLVRSATVLAERFGVPKGLMGLSIGALGTSAPLIVIAIQAARRHEHDLVVGNVLGTNLFIAFGGSMILGLMGGAHTQLLGSVSVITMGTAVLASWIFMARGRILTRWEACVLLAMAPVAVLASAR